MYKKRENRKSPEDDTDKVNTNRYLTKSLIENIAVFKKILRNDNTVIFREIENAHDNSYKSCLVYIDGMINTDIVNENIICPIMNAQFKTSANDRLDELKSRIICAYQIEKTGSVEELLLTLFNGDSILMLDNCDDALVISCKGWQMRALNEPDMERAVRGPREGFNESILVNLSLIRRRLKTPDLKFKFKEIGVRSRTRICICYIDTLARDEILKELESRLDRVDIDAIMDSGYLQELIKDSPLSPFKTIGSTERPDVVAAKLLEGRIAVAVDGSPNVMTLPYVFWEYFQSADDYYANYYFASINRLLRCLGEFFTTSIPAIILSVLTYHQEMIPSPMLLSISAARQGVPFPTIVEAIILLFIFEVIRESSTRLPPFIGQSVNIVGALILGQASIEARIFSAPMVIIVAGTGITGLLNYRLKGFSILIRPILLLLAAFMGLYGYVAGVMGVLIYMFSIRSFGVPYMEEFGSLNSIDLKDTFIRAPWWYMTLRPKHTAAKNIVRQAVSKPKGKQGK